MAESKNEQSLAQERKEFLKDFRKEQEYWRFVLGNRSNSNKTSLIVAVELEKCLGAKLPKFDPENITYLCEKMKPICLKDLHDSHHFVFKNCMLKLTIIDDPLLLDSGMFLAVEDENAEVYCAFVNKLPENEQAYENLKVGFGTVIGLVHPFQRITADGVQSIRVEDPNTVVVLGKKKDMCRYCGKENAKKKCSICKRSYCGRECQVSDWNDLNHKKICAEIDWCNEPKRRPDIIIVP